MAGWPEPPNQRWRSNRRSPEIRTNQSGFGHQQLVRRIEQTRALATRERFKICLPYGSRNQWVMRPLIRTPTSPHLCAFPSARSADASRYQESTTAVVLPCSTTRALVRRRARVRRSRSSRPPAVPRSNNRRAARRRHLLEVKRRGHADVVSCAGFGPQDLWCSST
jgi:hypothetical protein